jgi:hypothetical protein
MLSPINLKNNSKDFFTINSIKNVYSSKSKLVKTTHVPQNNQLIRLIQINPLKTSDQPISPKRNQNNLTEISNVKYIPRRFAPGFPVEIPLKNIGRSTLDCKKLFGPRGSNSNNNIEKYDENNKKSFNNIKNNSFKNEYIVKFSNNSRNFNKLEKYFEFISSENQNNFQAIFTKIKESLKLQTQMLFSNNNNYYDKENIKNYIEDIKSGFYKYRNDRTFSLPKIPTTIAHDESNDISNTDQNIAPTPSKDNETENFNFKNISMELYEYGSLINKFLNIILNDLRQCKNSNKKINQKMTEYEIRLANNNKEIENMKKFLNKYEVSSKIYLKIKNEKELDKVKASFNQKENQYILSIYKLEEEIKTLTSLLDHNQKYYHQCKDLQKEIDIGKKKNEELKFMFNQEMHEKNIERAIERETEEDLLQKMENLNEIIEELKKEADTRRKNDIENQIKIKKLNMILEEKNENIMMLNEELDIYIRELNKVRNSLNITKIELNNLENVILNTIKEKDKDKDNNTKENDKELDESIMQTNSNNGNINNYSLDNDKNKSSSDIPPLNLSLITKLQNSPPKL